MIKSRDPGRRSVLTVVVGPRALVRQEIAEGVYAVGLVVAGESLLAANPFPFLLIVGVLIVIGTGTGLLLRVIKNRKGSAGRA